MDNIKFILTFCIIATCLSLMGQTSDTSYFPKFTPYTQSPIIAFGDEMDGAPWNDPTVLKENNQYIMYTSGVKGGINHPNDTLGIYRWLSSDGYSWNLNPKTSVSKAKSGTYYEGGVETPSVVFFQGKYHMYNTVYTQNIPSNFRIAHAISLDGINWTMDNTPILGPDKNISWMGEIVAEPGVMIKEDTVYLFFTSIASDGGQTIGLARSLDGVNFIDTTQIVSLPTDVYPVSANYVGLSTPSPLLVRDTIYLFTDVAQFIDGNWKQVALHQFKSYGNIHKWYADTLPIHTFADISWIQGNINSEIRSITPLLDEQKLRIWYAGHNISEVDPISKDTIYHVHFVGNELHVNDGYWGIGTSEYSFNTVTHTQLNLTKDSDFTIRFVDNSLQINSSDDANSILFIYSIEGDILLEETFSNSINIDWEEKGTFIIKLNSQKSVFVEKIIIP